MQMCILSGEARRTFYAQDEADDVFTRTFRKGIEWGNQEGAIYPVNSMGDIFYPPSGLYGLSGNPLSGYGSFRR